MMELTLDRAIIIIKRDEKMLVYYNLESNQSWIIFGQCDLSGTCWNLELKLDCPVRPEIKDSCNCGLFGVYCQ